jgi:hypothetical protein
MATNRAMLKEAIADAKAVKETAIANAKAALEEAFTPQLKSMFSLKLQEMEDEYKTDKTEYDDPAYTAKKAAKLTKFKPVDEDGFGKFDTEENTGYNNDMFEKALDEDEDMMEVDLEELLAELNEEDEMEGLYEAEDDDMSDDMSDEESDEEEGEPMDLEDMTDEDLKDMIEDVIKDMIAAGELEAGHEGMENEEGAEEKTEEESEEEVDLAELLKEIEEMEEPVDEIFGLGKKGGNSYKTVIAQLMADNKDVVKAVAAETDPAKKKQIADPLLKKALAEFSKLKRENPGEDVIANMNEFKREVFGDPRSLLQKLGAGTSTQVAAREGMEEELAEAYSTIKILKNELNEINLLNAKLLYSNKIFKSKNLNESQKVKVLSSFDKANTVGEVKMVFETLNEGIKVVKTTIKENLGSASKLTSTPTAKKPIVESNDAFLRMQKLAGLI